MDFLEKLNNNPEVYYVPFPKESNKVFLDIFVKEGSIHDGFDNLGTTHLLEHYLLDEHQEKSNFEVNSNGGVGFEDSYFYIESTKEEILKDSEIFLDNILGEKSFDNEKRIKEEKETILNEFQDYINSPGDIIQNNFKKEALGKDCPYVKDYEKESENLKKITLNNLKERHKSLFSENKLIIIIGGYKIPKETLDKIVSEINKHNLPKSKEPEYPKYEINKLNDKRVKVPNIKGVYSSLVFSGPNLESTLEDRILTNIFCKLLADASNIPIFKSLRKNGFYGLMYKVYFYKKFGLIFFYSNLESENIEKFFNLLKEGIKEIKEKGFNEKLIKRTVSYALEGNKEEWDSNTGRYQWISDDLISNNKVFKIEDCLDIIKSIDNKKLKIWMDKYINLENPSSISIGEVK